MMMRKFLNCNILGLMTKFHIENKIIRKRLQNFATRNICFDNSYEIVCNILMYIIPIIFKFNKNEKPHKKISTINKSKQLKDDLFFKFTLIPGKCEAPLFIAFRKYFSDKLKIKQMKIVTIIFLSFFGFQSGVFAQVTTAASNDSTLSKTIKKRPWLTAVEVIGTNIIINRFDANVRNVEWAKVTPESCKANLKAGLQTDFDYFTTNWLGHPFHGSLMYNAARCNGYNFWQSIPFTLGGSFMWEYFAETEVPSKADLINTTLGGIYLGELTHRIGDIFMRKIKKPVLKHTLTAIVNPMSQINSLIVKGSNKPDTAFNPLINGQFSVGGSIPFGNDQYNILGKGAYIGLNLTYGDLFTKTQKKYKPFDYFRVNSSLVLNFEDSTSIYFTLQSNAPLFVKHLNKNAVLSVSQHYDYLTSNMYKIGAMTISGDYSFQHLWHNNNYLMASLKAGFIIIGSSQSEIISQIYNTDKPYFFRDYTFGNGFKAAADIFFSTKKMGKISCNINKWVLYASDTKGTDNLVLTTVEYNYPIGKKLNIGLQSSYFKRTADYNDFSDYRNIKNEYYNFRVLAGLRF